MKTMLSFIILMTIAIGCNQGDKQDRLRELESRRDALDQEITDLKAELANQNNIDVIITDHHTIPEKIPNAFSIIHPKLPGEAYPDKGLAGGAVAFKLAQGMLKKHKEKNEKLPNAQMHEGLEKWLLDMVAISSVADMVPLIGESRTLTKYGLIVLNKTKRIGMQKLLLEARLMVEEGGMKKELDSDL